MAWIIAAFVSIQSIYVAYFGPWNIAYGLNMLVGAAIVIVLITKPTIDPYEHHSSAVRAAGLVLDWLMIAVIVASCIRFTQVAYLMEQTLYFFSSFDLWLSLGGIAVLLEATRRLFGLPIVVIAILTLVYCFFGNSLPGFLNHPGISLDRAMDTIWYGYQGVFGSPTSVVIRVVLIFVVFGVVLEGTGASDTLIRVSVALTGKTRGGPAHSAVVASALLGSMSGSVTANVVGSGSFTIPMIKRRGFPAATAGGIEAAASTGGQIMPPVMGAAAFMMADLTGEPYTTIALAALVPALFYYGSLFAAVSVDANAAGIQPIPESERITLTRADYIASLQFLLPIVSIIIVLLLGRSPTMAGLVAVTLALALGLFRKKNRSSLNLYWDIAVKAGIACASILVAVGCIGIILGVMNLTGVGLSFASMISSLSEESLLWSLIITAFACLVLGMGMPTLPAYIIIVLVLGPVVTNLGADLLAVHMFVLYFGVLSAITPPVAIGAFAAAPIAGSNPMRTAFVAVRLAIVGFIIPFIFIYEPSLLLVLDFDLLSFIRVCTALSLAIWMLNTGAAGYASERLSLFGRAVRIALAVGLIIQIPELQYLCILAAVGLLAIHKSPRLAETAMFVKTTEHSPEET
ncbi:TRAP transporter fused permease subunit [Phaeobacter sp. J2-8]|uniref:TRAP transporter permease n=1 Tax=Phaeobacter sp. J2-8 TaxID=2931394 RepID=UPI001FD29FDE|nr:TRAP transporter fused permease subunit [Phaeobacter sp. J2-8]MCJ7873411.1 TRAP transporter fused permease subunit [Phaeobacter sp. J2-8]